MALKRLTLTILKNGLLAGAVLATAGVSAILSMRAVLLTQEVQAPDLRGRSVSEAERLTLGRRLGLKVEGRRFDPGVPVGRILLQEPEAGATLKTGRNLRVWLSQGQRRVEIPAVEGSDLRTARLALAQAAIPLGRLVEIDAASPEGTVLDQEPPPGEMLAETAAVSLLVSRGPGRIAWVMPDVIGWSGEDAVTLLGRLGRAPSVRYRAYPGVTEGVVLRQTPASGYPVTPTSAVGLEISQGNS